MVITAIKPQVRRADRFSIFLDEKYSFSLSLEQLADFKLKVGQDLSADDLIFYKEQSQKIKIYRKAIDYCLLRSRSVLEVDQYLERKIRDYQKNKLASSLTESQLKKEIIQDLKKDGYLDDSQFAKKWVENRFYKKGISRRRLVLELRKKGVAEDNINEALTETDRDDRQELVKVIARKRKLYSDKTKLIRYLQRIGFSYGDIIAVLNDEV